MLVRFSFSGCVCVIVHWPHERSPRSEFVCSSVRSYGFLCTCLSVGVCICVYWHRCVCVLGSDSCVCICASGGAASLVLEMVARSSFIYSHVMYTHIADSETVSLPTTLLQFL